MNKIKINSWDEFSPLEAVIVGSVFDGSFFDGVKDTKTADVLKKICDETNEDIEYFKSQMRSHNIEVFHAMPTELGYHSSILDYVDPNGKMGYQTEMSASVKPNLIPTVPLQVRDDTIIMGDKIFVTANTFEVQGYVKKYLEWFGEDQVDLSLFNENTKFKRSIDNLKSMARDEGKPEDYYITNSIPVDQELSGFCSPNLCRVGKTCLVDMWQTGDILEYMQSKFPQFDYKTLSIGGHLDGIFSVLKPGVVISGEWFRGNENLFKNWDIVYFEDANWNHVFEWEQLKQQNRGTWWVPGQEQNENFTNFVNTFLSTWTGFVEETIFDINTLVIDDRYVVVNSNSKQLRDALKKYNLEPIYCPLRHQFFWDGGWHCLTLDVRRKGVQNDYGV
jgi:hypothetical protein